MRARAEAAQHRRVRREVRRARLGRLGLGGLELFVAGLSRLLLVRDHARLGRGLGRLLLCGRVLLLLARLEARLPLAQLAVPDRALALLQVVHVLPLHGIPVDHHGRRLDHPLAAAVREPHFLLGRVCVVARDGRQHPRALERLAPIDGGARGLDVLRQDAKFAIAIGVDDVKSSIVDLEDLAIEPARAYEAVRSCAVARLDGLPDREPHGPSLSWCVRGACRVGAFPAKIFICEFCFLLGILCFGPRP